jgi:HAD superfamily hydrolase (TIGR01484 family)
MHVDALITDLDGTFWAPDMSIHDVSLAVVAAADLAGLPFVIATGRRARGAMRGLSPVGLDNRPAILMNGALARDALAGESFLVDAMDREDALAVAEAFDEIGLEPLVYIDHPETDLVIGPAPSAGADYLRQAPGVLEVPSLLTAIESETTIGFGAFGFPRELLDPLADYINRNELATAIVGQSHLEGDHGLMIQAHKVDKQTGIEAWCERQGIDHRRVAVVGDGHNDIEMLRAAAIAIVPSNAAEEILDLADVVIQPNEDGGWEQIPDIIGL